MIQTMMLLPLPVYRWYVQDVCSFVVLPFEHDVWTAGQAQKTTDCRDDDSSLLTKHVCTSHSTISHLLPCDVSASTGTSADHTGTGTGIIRNLSHSMYCM